MNTDGHGCNKLKNRVILPTFLPPSSSSFYPSPQPGKATLSEKFALRMGKSNRKTPFLTPLKAAVYAASLPRPCSAPPPSSRNGIGLQ